MVQHWKEMTIEKVAAIERLVEIFQIWSIPLFPYLQVKFYLYEVQDGGYLGRADMAAKKKGTDIPDWIESRGDTLVETLEQAIRGLLQSIAVNGATAENDFVWKNILEDEDDHHG